MPDLFLSYARDDQDIARRFAENLQREGFEVWWDQALNPGEAFDQVTEEALAAASAVIVLWSKSSVSSRWVRAEATQANANHRLLPVMIEPCTRPIMFELTHTADLSNWKGGRDDPAWQAFVASVRRFVQRRGSGESAVVPALRPETMALPRPTPRERMARAVGVLGAAATWAGSLLRRYWGRLAFALALAVVASVMTWTLRPRIEREVTRFSIEVPPAIFGGGGFALSPDGRRLVYGIAGQLWSRRLDQDEPTQIPGADGATALFFSPDGRSIAFFATDKSDNKLKAFDFSGEATRVLADIGQAPGMAGAWDSKGRIFYGLSGPYGLSKVAAVGGIPEAFAPLGNYGDLDYPDVLPGGSWVLFTAHVGQLGLDQGNWSSADIVAQSVATVERKIVLKGGHFARYLPTGHLVFARNGTLYAVAFDSQRLATRGREVPVLQGLGTDETSGFAAYVVSANGTLVYGRGTPGGRGDALKKSIVRVSRNGEVTGLSADARNYSTPRAAPDGSKIAVEVTDGNQHVHIWIMDVKTGGATQLTFDGDEDRFPVWTADSREVLFTSKRGKDYALWRKAADGSGEARKVLDGTDALVATDVHDHTLIYQDRGAGGMQRDLFTFDLTAKGSPQPLLATPEDEAGGRVSPDGKWIAYVSTPVGGATVDRRVYVRPFPNSAAGGQRAISDGTGAAPAWSMAGDQIYYSVNAAPVPLNAVSIAATPTTITPTGRRELFDMANRFVFNRMGTSLGYGFVYEVLPKSDEFLAVAAADTPRAPEGAQATPSTQHLYVVLNWFEELKKLVPTE